MPITVGTADTCRNINLETIQSVTYEYGIFLDLHNKINLKQNGYDLR